ncbi:MAG: hypothetical protein A3B70_08445 [Deltaproteobacteria bacterium RIFCSPHIGHO2_02_FULL_40_11]|nr:MAG: hypothetical protein A3B70_08445 [Deltaproteobacteria bacterium RIFCSPHIGHO2_02_FULL_40_11]
MKGMLMKTLSILFLSLSFLISAPGFAQESMYDEGVDTEITQEDISEDLVLWAKNTALKLESALTELKSKRQASKKEFFIQKIKESVQEAQNYPQLLLMRFCLNRALRLDEIFRGHDDDLVLNLILVPAVKQAIDLYRRADLPFLEESFKNMDQKEFLPPPYAAFTKSNIHYFINISYFHRSWAGQLDVLKYAVAWVAQDMKRSSATRLNAMNSNLIIKLEKKFEKIIEFEKEGVNYTHLIQIRNALLEVFEKMTVEKNVFPIDSPLQVSLDEEKNSYYFVPEVPEVPVAPPFPLLSSGDVLLQHKDVIQDIRLSQDDRYVMVAGENKEIQVFDLKKNNLLGTIQSPLQLLSYGFLNRFNKVYAIYAEQVLILMDLETGLKEEVSVTALPDHPYFKAILTQDEKYFVVGFAHKIFLFDIENRVTREVEIVSQIRHRIDSYIDTFDISLDGRILFVEYGHGVALYALDFTSGEILQSVDAQKSNAYTQLEYVSRNHMAYVLRGGVFYIWNLENNVFKKLEDSYYRDHFFHGMKKISPDQKYLLVRGGNGREYRILDVASNSFLHSISSYGEAHSFSETGEFFLVAQEVGESYRRELSFQVFRTDHFSSLLTQTLQQETQERYQFFFRKNKLIYVRRTQIFEFDLSHPKNEPKIYQLYNDAPFSYYNLIAAVSSEGRFVITNDKDRKVYFWKLDNLD